MSQTVLVVAPHGLDESLGCGGVMARHADDGDTVHTLVLFGDGTGRDAKRRVNACAAVQILGTKEPSFTGFAENRSDTIPLTEIISAVERCVAEIKPQVVYVSHGGNLNIDHQTAFKATVTALRPVPGAFVRAVYAYEILSSTDWAPPGFAVPFRPTLFVDITAQLGRKLNALAAYGDEMRPEPHARSLASARTAALARGAIVGVGAAEAFEVIRQLVA